MNKREWKAWRWQARRMLRLWHKLGCSKGSGRSRAIARLALHEMNIGRVRA